MKIGDRVICIDDDWWWVMEHGGKERMAGPNPVRDQIYTVTHTEPCDWLRYGQGPNYLLSLQGFSRRYSHRHFRVVRKTDISQLLALSVIDSARQPG